MLEYFVHIDTDDPPGDLVLAVAEVPDDLTREEIKVNELPATWRNAAAAPELAKFGDEFAQISFHSLLLAPSVLSSSESNLLINPEHPDYNRISVLGLEPLSYDPRMFSKRNKRREKPA